MKPNPGIKKTKQLGALVEVVQKPTPRQIRNLNILNKNLAIFRLARGPGKVCSVLSAQLTRCAAAARTKFLGLYWFSLTASTYCFSVTFTVP